MRNDQLTAEAIAFFQGRSAYQKVLEIAVQKYRSHGQITGSMPLSQFTDDEKQMLAGFLGISLDELTAKKSVRFAKWLEAYQNSRFHEVPFQVVVEGVLGIALQTKEEIAAAKEMAFQNFVEKVMGHAALAFLNLEQIKELYRQDVTEVELCLCAAMLTNKPEEEMYLPVFAQKHLGNPHGLDRGSRMGGLLQLLLQYRYEPVREKFESATEFRNRLFLNHRLLLDDLMNFVSVVNLTAEKTMGKRHPMWEAASEEHAVWNVPIKTLLQVCTVQPYHSKQLWIFENSALFSALLDYFPELPAVCHQGQFRYAFWKLLDLVPTDIQIFYASDMDPEGLGMAQRVKERYGKRVQFVLMDRAHYLATCSKEISTERLKQLDSLEDEDLREIALEMQRIGQAAYQEALFEEYAAFIRATLDVGEKE